MKILNFGESAEDWRGRFVANFDSFLLAFFIIELDTDSLLWKDLKYERCTSGILQKVKQVERES